MAKHLLTNVAVKALDKPGRHSDGEGLYLAIDQYGKRWVMLFRMAGKRREMGLGAYPTISLAKARDRADAARKLVEDGIDPIEAKKAPKGAVTFGTLAEELIEDLRSGWTGAKTEQGWRRSLLTHAAPLKDKALDAIGTEDVLAVVRPYWNDKPESGQKLRARIEVALDAAKVRGLRTGDNPARWRGHLDRLLSKPRKLARGHHRSLHYRDAPALMLALSQRRGMSARALEWTIYTCAREGMTLGMTWAELDNDWTVPAERMKGRKPFTVPLSVQCRAVLEHCDRSTPYVFPGFKLDRPLSDAAMDKMLKDMGVDATPHGFRSTFRDWAGDMTAHSEEVAEAALAHVFGSATRRAYRRSVDLENLRALLQDWADYLSPPPIR